MRHPDNPKVLKNIKNPKNAIQPNDYVGKPAYSSSGLFAGSDLTVDSFNCIERSSGRISDFSNLDTNISGRPGFTRQHYDAFRPTEAISDDVNEAVRLAHIAYRTNGIVKSVLDLMSDFACEGIRIVHPNKTIEKFYNKWFDLVDGKDRSERFLNGLYKSARVIVRAMTSPVPRRRALAETVEAAADPDMDSVPKVPFIRGELPVKYVFLHPLTVGTVGGKYASFVGNPQYFLKPQSDILSAFTKDESKDVMSDLPKDLQKSLKSGKNILLDTNKTFVFHYKKDDWDEWAYPFVFPILQDIVTLNKLKLADNAALDGAISNLRIIKLGSMEYKIAPTPAAAAKISDILQSHTGGGSIDIIWGPDIELIESSTNLHQILGEGKYTPYLNSIYDCLGVPSTLTASSGGSSGTTNNYISLKTLIRRLDYGRDKLAEFWNEQLKIVQKVMGFALAGKIEFNYLELGDDASQKALLVQLADRNIVSEEYIQRIFGTDPEIENVRTNREERFRKSGRKAQKAGPFHDPQFKESLKKIALQSGFLSPEQVGITPEPGTAGKKSPFDKEMALKNKQANQTNQQNQSVKPPKTDTRKMKGERGRPKNSKDKQKRKTREFKPKTKAMLEIWANDAQSKIAEVMKPLFLKKYNKKTMRQLNAFETEQAELMKFGVLSNVEPFTDIDLETVKLALTKPLLAKFTDTFNELVLAVKQEFGNSISINLEERRNIQALVYSIYKGEGG